MSIKKNGGIFGRNPTYYNVEVENDLRVGGNLIINGETVTGLDFEGSWDASTNTPDVTASPTVGQFWIVSVAGNTDLSGITTWDVGDWALYDGSSWQRVEGGGNGTFTSVSVSGTSNLDGAVVINESGADVDFRVESNTNTHALFVQGSDGKVGIGTSVINSKLHVNGPAKISVNSNNITQASNAPSFELIRFNLGNSGTTPLRLSGDIILGVSLSRGSYNNLYGSIFIDAFFAFNVCSYNFNQNQALTAIVENVNQKLEVSVGGPLTSASIAAQVSYDGGTTWVTADGTNQGNTDVWGRLVLNAVSTNYDRWTIDYSLTHTSNNNAIVVLSDTITDIT